MAKKTLNMGSPYSLTEKTIGDKVEEKIGNYALGHIKVSGDSKTFIVGYVGRSDSNIKTEIEQQGLELKVDKDKNPIYTHFKFSYAISEKDAYTKECQNYHDFGGKEKLKNNNHPDLPTGVTRDDLKCPIESCHINKEA